MFCIWGSSFREVKYFVWGYIVSKRVVEVYDEFVYGWVFFVKCLYIVKYFVNDYYRVGEEIN